MIPKLLAEISILSIRASFAAGFKSYEQEEDSTGDIAEFSLANALYLALVEGHAAEQSARRTAMDNGQFGRWNSFDQMRTRY